MNFSWTHKASLFLHSSVLIYFGSRTGCGWQIISEMGFGNCSYCSATVLLNRWAQWILNVFWTSVSFFMSRKHCQHFSYCLLEVEALGFSHHFLTHNYLTFVAGFSATSHTAPFLVFFFLNKENSQDVSACCHERVPTVLTDLLKDLFFAQELHIWPGMIILGSVLVEIIGRSHLKKVIGWLAYFILICCFRHSHIPIMEYITICKNCHLTHLLRGMW